MRCPAHSPKRPIEVKELAVLHRAKAELPPEALRRKLCLDRHAAK
jgi:hypothetical protein